MKRVVGMLMLAGGLLWLLAGGHLEGSGEAEVQSLLAGLTFVTLCEGLLLLITMENPANGGDEKGETGLNR
ncbi:hypothetical protein [Pseudomonas panipatensis]|uniref:Uncharacterized protein n=1 Tax=Pseudomonas panipatensis TaxID=428992 RepID=A0A1G8GI96_9PSED|nr:hypothetical protein [Pseudomonas panipatensis]SDH94114.1 hypothetical protein SAMN05216272_104286 [Pseudomonas panipatensis]SMP43124.1 hypothetical protein SAMN06295951_101698 [Pseudomonas panipatensis]